MNISPFWKNWIERVSWTAAQGVVAVIIVNATNLDGWYVPILVTGLSALKGWIGRHVGNPNTAAIGGDF